MNRCRNIKCALTIAGSDSGGGAGVQADMLAFAANGVFAASAIAAITAQNPDGVRAVSAVPADVFAAQIEAVAEYFKPEATKTGMLFDAEHIEIAADFARRNREMRLVVDPVMISTSGSKLLRDDAVRVLREKLLPLATLITPNLDEARELLGAEIKDVATAARGLSRKFSTAVLLKGGHLDGDDIADALCSKSGEVRVFESKRVKNVNTHGSGCTLSAAIAANLANGAGLEKSVENARNYLLRGMRNPVRAGAKNENFINHFPDFF